MCAPHAQREARANNTHAGTHANANTQRCDSVEFVHGPRGRTRVAKKMCIWWAQWIRSTQRVAPPHRPWRESSERVKAARRLRKKSSAQMEPEGGVGRAASGGVRPGERVKRVVVLRTHWSGRTMVGQKRGEFVASAKGNRRHKWSIRRPRRPHPSGASGSSTLQPSAIAFAPDGPGPTRRPTRSSSTREAHSQPVVWHGAQTGQCRSPALRPRGTRSPTVSS